MTFRSIISSLAVMAQLLLVLSAAARGGAAPCRAASAMADAVIVPASLPVRNGPAAVPEPLRTVPRYRAGTGISSGILSGAGSTPQAAAASAGSSFPGYAVLLI